MVDRFRALRFAPSVDFGRTRELTFISVSSTRSATGNGPGTRTKCVEDSSPDIGTVLSLRRAVRPQRAALPRVATAHPSAGVRLRQSASVAANRPKMRNVFRHGRAARNSRASVQRPKSPLLRTARSARDRFSFAYTKRRVLTRRFSRKSTTCVRIFSANRWVRVWPIGFAPSVSLRPLILIELIFISVSSTCSASPRSVNPTRVSHAFYVDRSEVFDLQSWDTVREAKVSSH